MAVSSPLSRISRSFFAVGHPDGPAKRDRRPLPPLSRPGGLKPHAQRVVGCSPSVATSGHAGLGGSKNAKYAITELRLRQHQAPKLERLNAGPFFPRWQSERRLGSLRVVPK